MVPIGIRLREEMAGDTCGTVMNPKFKTAEEFRMKKTSQHRAEQMFKRHDAGRE